MKCEICNTQSPEIVYYQYRKRDVCACCKRQEQEQAQNTKRDFVMI